MTIRRAIIIENDLPTPIFAHRIYESKVKYIKRALAIKIEFITSESEEVFKILVNSQWKDVIETKIVIGGEWKNVISSNIIVDGEWKN